MGVFKRGVKHCFGSFLTVVAPCFCTVCASIKQQSFSHVSVSLKPESFAGKLSLKIQPETVKAINFSRLLIWHDGCSYLNVFNLKEINMSTPLAGKKVAILATDGFEQSERYLLVKRYRCRCRGRHYLIAAPFEVGRTTGAKK